MDENPTVQKRCSVTTALSFARDNRMARAIGSNSALALGAKHIRRSVSEASLKPSEFDPKKRMRSTNFLEEPDFLNERWGIIW